jgi:hypothetical protein
MSTTQGGGNIVTDGLVLCLDTANIKSYPGSGLIWSDLSSNLKDWTLSSQPTFSNNNMGSLVFNGEYAQTDKNILLNLNNFSNWSIETWIYRTGLGTSFRSNILGIDTIFNINSTVMAVANGGNFFIGGDGGPNMNPVVSSTSLILLNTWYHIVVVKNNNNVKIYINGVENTSQTRTNFLWSDLGITAKIGNRTAGDTQFFGRIPIVRIYSNKSLSPSEVLQNYNTHKGRYGL